MQKSNAAIELDTLKKELVPITPAAVQYAERYRATAEKYKLMLVRKEREAKAAAAKSANQSAAAPAPGLSKKQGK